MTEQMFQSDGSGIGRKVIFPMELWLGINVSLENGMPKLTANQEHVAVDIV
jgi:hypothetical protein